ncbi:MAG: 2-C-methyl-D-erythritol 4-phosphate cytidylyltransferase [Desulfamplus sp.]|nr:2-C-methyl-D-erythritol 4-phosphate cytidylyltransferase [Desulfamplus sp.]
MNNHEIYAVIVAGGKGVRMDSKIRKQYINIAGEPIIVHTLRAFTTFSQIGKIALVTPKEDFDYCLKNIISAYGFGEKVFVVSGGKERQHSVLNGLKKIDQLSKLNDKGGLAQSKTLINRKIVLIHDGVRPFVDHKIIARSIDCALKHGASIPVVPVTDTLKLMDSDGFVAGVVDRANLYKVQTPQVFDLELIIRAHEDAVKSNYLATDDASLVERLGQKVFMTKGSVINIKITTQDDLLFAKYIFFDLNGSKK